MTIEEKIRQLIRAISESMKDLEISIYQRYTGEYDNEEIDQETLEKLLDVDQDSKEVQSLDPIYDLDNHSWDCGKWHTYNGIRQDLNKILNDGNQD